MPSRDVLDFAKLLAPIPGDKPVGIDLRTDTSPSSPYWTVKNLRKAARDNEINLSKAADEDKEKVPRADWRPVIQKGNEALAGKSKDFEIVAYMIEALVRVNGFAGLRDGFRLARELSEKYWDAIYPLPDEEGVETRVAALTSLNGQDSTGTLIAPIMWVPITASPSGRFNSANYTEAGNLNKISDAAIRAKRIAAGAVTIEIFEKAVTETPKPFYATLMEDLTATLEEFAKLNAELTKRCADKAPPASSIREALVNTQDLIKNVAKNKLDVAPPPEEPATKDGAAPDGAAAPKTGGQPMDVLRTRDDAFRIISKVADFFRRTEPHNPVSYALEQAVRWAQMPLPELLSELVPEEGPRKGLFKQVGIKAPEPPPKK